MKNNKKICQITLYYYSTYLSQLTFFNFSFYFIVNNLVLVRVNTNAIGIMFPTEFFSEIIDSFLEALF